MNANKQGMLLYVLKCSKQSWQNANVRCSAVPTLHKLDSNGISIACTEQDLGDCCSSTNRGTGKETMGFIQVSYVTGMVYIPDNPCLSWLYELHWNTNENALVWQGHGTGPEYEHELLTVQEDVRDLRPEHNVVCLKEPRTKLVTGGDRSFEKAAACLWNCIPVSLRNTYSLDSFTSGLKWYLYVTPKKCPTPNAPVPLCRINSRTRMNVKCLKFAPIPVGDITNHVYFSFELGSFSIIVR